MSKYYNKQDVKPILVALLSNPVYMKSFEDEMVQSINLNNDAMEEIITDACHLAYLLDKVTDKWLD